MKKLLQAAFTIYILALMVLEQTANAIEVLVDTGQRQTVVERTKQYAGSVDAIKVRNEMSAVFKKDLKKGNGSSITGANAKCGGFTSSVCGVPCCGKTECESVCRANTTLAHGNTCTSPYRTSRCGMSCCGKQDCDTVCDNYRTSTVSKKNCGGYVKTATGQDCCGFDDCRNRSCGGQTSVISADYGKELECCGADNCKDVKCDYQHSTEVVSGGTVKCCGTKDCYRKYCEGQTSVDSKVDPNKKNLQCCGKVNCHNVECDGYVTTKTPHGQEECCGYDDCRNKECEYQLSVKNYKGETVPCCGKADCATKALPKTYEEPVHKCTTVKKTCVKREYKTNYSRCSTTGCETFLVETPYDCSYNSCCNTTQSVYYTTKTVFTSSDIPSNCQKVHSFSCWSSSSVQFCSLKCAKVVNNCDKPRECLKKHTEIGGGSYTIITTYCDKWSDGSSPGVIDARYQ